MKNVSSRHFLAVLALLCSSVGYAATATVTPSIADPRVGDTFFVTVSGAGFPDTVGATLKLFFDSTKVAVKTPTLTNGIVLAPGSPFTGGMVGPSPFLSGNILSVLAPTVGTLPSGNFDAFRVYFTALAAGPANIVLSDDQADFSWTDATTFLAIPVTYTQAQVGIINGATARDDGPIAVIEGIAKVIAVGANDVGFTDPVSLALTALPTKGTISAFSPPGPAAGMTITYTANFGAVGTDTFVYQMTDSTAASDSATVTLNISPTPDPVPNAFAFIDQTDVPLNAVITSNTVTIAGINVPTPISVVGGEYSINGGTFTALAGSVVNGNTVTVLRNSAATPLTATNATVTIGGVTDTFTVTTGPDTDGDGVVDGVDNCTLLANTQAGNVPGTSVPRYQLDSDNDGYGNACDADLNNSGLVTAADFAILRSVLNELASYSPQSAAADLNGSGTVTATDFAILRSRLNTPPGPSGLHP